ncbi:uncharacterized protein PV09_05559 [Verruconis gallopava]|uniref:Uncharacterized protein n=1 Tax=Verruconis gallopava TaxID=253628 RepID=A0A0D1XLQ2_9PEZI|nr:uncharacterized protein PV09_05559 [Verruconis gallopava]KIW03351.1 hypothetical protein PV09_05559 [Verruconis gallopava]
MLAARADQENAVHARQTAAAAKPLNQGVQGFSAKTPGNRAPKTPFKVALNDENRVEVFGKSALGTNGKNLGGKQQLGKADKNLFQTPAPRDRPALGFKTTNAKANAFQTPAPKNFGPSPEKTQRRTVGRSRIQIHKEVKEAGQEIDWSNEEIQYIPPRPNPLPDKASDDEWDKVDFSILKTGNFETARWIEFYAQKGAQEEAKEEQLRERERLQMNKNDEEFYRKTLEDLREPDSDEDLPQTKSFALKQDSRSLNTITSRAAASALSQPTRTAPSYAAPTAATKAKASLGTVNHHQKTTPATLRSHARASSYSTLGYAKGRSISDSLKQERLKPDPRRGGEPLKPKRKDPLRELEELIRAREYEEAGINTDDVDDAELGGVSLLNIDDDEEDFQMKMPDVQM